jgi:hypothetical protein
MAFFFALLVVSIVRIVREDAMRADRGGNACRIIVPYVLECPAFGRPRFVDFIFVHPAELGN